MIRMFFLFLLTSSSFFQVAYGHDLVGTSPREELEIKNSFWVEKGFDQKTLALALHSNLSNYINITSEVSSLIKELDEAEKIRSLYNKQFLKSPKNSLEIRKRIILDYKKSVKEQAKIWKLVNTLESNYYLDDIKKIIFNDIYFDTNSEDLFKKNNVYRFRQRLKSVFQFEIFDSFDLFQNIIRCEVQAKRYESTESKFIQSTEVRFEGLSPLNNGCSVANGSNVLRSGRYQNKTIKPFHFVSKNSPKIKLEPKLRIKTIRYRFHLNMLHPFGSGGNPDDVILVTVDKSTCLKPDACNKKLKKNDLLEVEIELSRNFITNLNKKVNLADEDPVYQKIASAALNVKKSAIYDINQIDWYVTNILSKFNLISRLENMPKYMRLKYTERKEDIQENP